MFRVPKETELIQCPYERSHQIMRSRFQVHLGRCRKSYPDTPKITCPFNVTHLVEKPEIDWHVAVCEDRLSFETFKHPEAPVVKPTPVPVMKNTNLIESSENWDNEPDVPTYDPTKYAESAPVLRLMQGAPPSEKKKFRKEEQRRLRNLQN